MFRRLSLLLLLAFLLSACATMAPGPVVEQDYDERAEVLRTLPGWSLSGRAAIRTAADSGTVSLDWRQEGEQYSVALRAPWGAGQVQVDGTPGWVRLRTSEGVDDYAAAPGELLAYYTGFDLPLESLRFWLLGIPDPGTEASYNLDELGLVDELRQHGWVIDYRRYQTVGTYVLPRTVFMRGDGIEVRVAVQAWEIAP
ncbi:outer membrane lipoprotein LolB [Alkalilimnicola ehrlichii]|uniref:Outer-membrane lipoprotein LolB n=1 Tax=Alkalilimnicola ehrlichii TaxID=351052 RepID=A0A3E0X3L2_9GAMM|nr:lipoprotein insertase outer membrane protein LolB [Alkalilimnicola ehrlichii]RFA31296.1 outer membrane lipoprotein LolB [Alkalilimnicola ehrlichii]RFA39432.1 outer membrane lipoprotein LolB [Alkalilimnicola ehrlichii]